MKEATWCDKCKGYRNDGAFAWAGSSPTPICNCICRHCGKEIQGQEFKSQIQQNQQIYIEPLFDLGTGIAQGDMTVVRKVNEIIAYLNSK